MRIFAPIINEIKLRIQENRELNITVSEELQRIKKERDEKTAKKKINIGVVNGIADKISYNNDRLAIKNFENKKKRELELIRNQRRYEYRKSIIFIIGIFCLVLALIITVGAIREERVYDNYTQIIEDDFNSESELQDSTAVMQEEEEQDDKENEIIDDGTSEFTEIESSEFFTTQDSNVFVSTTENAVSQTNNYKQEQVVWVSGNGGKKYHSRSSCSGMKSPMEITLDEAISRGYTACKKCN